MKAEDGIICCVCGDKAVERSFDGTGWCQIHHSDWKSFLRYHRGEFQGLSDAFNAWIQIARGYQ